MENAKKCMIIGASPLKSGAVFQEFDPREYYVICADGGYETALKYKIKPDYIVGDFDSSHSKPNQKNVKVSVLPVEKDVTDTMYAAFVGLRLGFKTFVMIGCLGGPRYDHTLANYNVMLYIANKGGDAIMADDSSKAFLLTNRKLTLQQMDDSIVSVFPFGTSTCNVSYTGLQYPLKEETLTSGDTLMGVSNRVIASVAEIKVHAGCALVIVITEK